MITTSCAVILIIIGSAIDWSICEPERWFLKFFVYLKPSRHMPPYKVTNFFLALGTLLFAYGGELFFHKDLVVLTAFFGLIDILI